MTCAEEFFIIRTVNMTRASQWTWLLLAGCAAAAPTGDEPWQGVVELDERRIAFEVPGRLLEVLVHEADRVEAGALLARLDPTLEEIGRDARRAEVVAADARLRLLQAGPRAEEVRAAAAELRAARDTLEVLRRDLARSSALADRGAVAVASTDRLRGEVRAAEERVHALAQRLQALRSGTRSQEIEIAEAQLEAARQGVRLAEARLERHRVTAPMAGTVLDVHLDPGELVAPGAPVVTLADLDAPYVDVFVPQNRIGEVALGAEVVAEVDSPEDRFEGRVEWIGRELEFTPRFLFSETERPNLVLRVRVRLSDPEHRLHAGVPARVRLQ